MSTITDSDQLGVEAIAAPMITSPRGFAAAGLHAGIKRKRKDLGLLYCHVPAAAAAVYTTNAFQAPPLGVTREGLAASNGRMQALLVNSGNANACTGEQGWEDAREMRRACAQALGISETLVGVTSTGVIGERLPLERIVDAVPPLTASLSPQGDQDFGAAILTTDTFTKAAEARVKVDGQEVRIAGAAKGSGMVHPNMATMLAFITTDAVIEPPVLQRLLKATTDESFNMITVDGDSSTNDMVTVMASGLAGHDTLDEGHPDWGAFQSAFTDVSRRLAQMIARDGEGATKLVEVTVQGAETLEGARQAAKTVVGSSLVKTAVYGEDPNWGRLLCALGYCGTYVDPERVDLWVGEHQLVQRGMAVPNAEEAAKEALVGDMVHFLLDLHQGTAAATAWGCDLTYDYVRINASYRT
ncbi:bifunctional glutamate N-acetyltransferase/amino-acid acetyltransferase ArgJ [Desmospora activa]|uniref:Arginine biosynthesis bifunctional protein ArgJ n=1 Tax=Desmospora activa DSM 45169 TaxID=1121389 RepID=A0A2T4Z485_9BACL|nr:bifunctional glutamate N-acetyltransferase/amino-acid acetyltransferase ArgJ [Desmospora activa]PTM56686.1 glutamate N-acetyltransferase [Desmospora activa DSM 45169]